MNFYPNEYMYDYGCCCCQPGPRGLRGCPGPRGEKGEPGSIDAFGVFYNSSAATVAPLGIIPISSTMTPPAKEMALVGNAIVLNDPGTYLINYQVYLTGAGAVGVALNGSIVPGSITEGTGLLSGQALIRTTAPNQTVTLVNAGSAAITLITPASGASNVIVSAVQLAEARKVY